MTFITDDDGDSILIDPAVNLGLTAFIQIEQEGENACVLLDEAKTVEVAEALLALAGRKLTPVDSLKSASRLSFNEGMLRLAAIHKRTVTFRYAKNDGAYIEARRLNPETVEPDGSAVLGHDPDRAAPRRYRLDRIKGEVAFA